MTKKSIITVVILAASVALILWITLFSRIGADIRKLYPPFWSYRAIASGSIRILLEVIGNVLLFVPIGISAVLLFGFSAWQTIVLGFSISLLIECAQWCFWLGAFEIDDLIHNTLGALVGAVLAGRTGLGQRIKLLTENRRRQLILFLTTVFTLISLSLAFQRINYLSMKSYAALSDREDGTKNILILNGEPGYVGSTDVYVAYNEDGSLSINGSSDTRAWKRIGTLTLNPGHYIFSGLSGTEEKTIAIELEHYDKEQRAFIRLTPDVGPIERVEFDLDEETRIKAYIGVYPGAEGDYLARPVIYRED